MATRRKTVPKNLQLFFILHFMIDLFFAIPLFLFPALFLPAIQFTASPEAITFARLIAAALIGIGTTSLLAHHKSTESYHTMLTLKLLWSASATLGLVISAIQFQHTLLYLFAAIFAAFFMLWAYWYQKLKS